MRTNVQMLLLKGLILVVIVLLCIALFSMKDLTYISSNGETFRKETTIFGVSLRSSEWSVPNHRDTNESLEGRSYSESPWVKFSETQFIGYRGRLHFDEGSRILRERDKIRNDLIQGEKGVDVDVR